jgi:NitT/TauT family transport system permease protein
LTLLYWTSPIFFVAVWSLISHSGIAPNQSIPSPVEFARSFWTLTISGTLPTEAAISFSRVVVGFTAAAVIGVPLGLLAGTFVVGRSLIGPTNSFFRYIPPTAFIALLIVYFGVGEKFKYAVVFLGVIFFITQMVIDVVDDMDSRYVEIALTSGLSNWEVFRRTIIPFCWPRIFDVLRINLSAAWTFLVAAELIGAERGLGHFIAVSQRFLRLGDLYSGIVTFGIIGLLTDFALELISRRLFRWYYISLKRD